MYKHNNTGPTNSRSQKIEKLHVNIVLLMSVRLHIRQILRIYKNQNKYIKIIGSTLRLLKPDIFRRKTSPFNHMYRIMLVR